jgi:hypothetical protein
MSRLARFGLAGHAASTGIAAMTSSMAADIEQSMMRMAISSNQ